jgi:hypothetical protein
MNSLVNFVGIKNDKGYIYNTTLNSTAGNILTNVYSPSDLNMDGKVNFIGIINDKSFLYNYILESNTGEIKNQLLP